MKTIITSTGNTTDSLFDKRFGKASWFCVLDERTGSTHFIKNETDETAQGACRHSAAKIIQLEPVRVIAGHFGPNAAKMLDKSGIQMVVPENQQRTVQDIINELNPTT